MKSRIGHPRLRIIRAWWPFRSIHDQAHDDDSGDEGGDAEDPDSNDKECAKNLGRHRDRITKHIPNSDVRGQVVAMETNVDWISLIEAWFRSCPCHSSEL